MSTDHRRGRTFWPEDKLVIIGAALFLACSLVVGVWDHFAPAPDGAGLLRANTHHEPGADAPRFFESAINIEGGGPP